MNKIVDSNSFDVTSDNYRPCEQHGGVHQVRTVTGAKGNKFVSVTEEKHGKVDAVISTPVYNTKGQKVTDKSVTYRGSQESVLEWLARRLLGG